MIGGGRRNCGLGELDGAQVDALLEMVPVTLELEVQADARARHGLVHRLVDDVHGTTLERARLAGRGGSSACGPEGVQERPQAAGLERQRPPQRTGIAAQKTQKKAPPAKQAGLWSSAITEWSGIRDSNSRPIPWQGIALPTELIPR